MLRKIIILLVATAAIIVSGCGNSSALQNRSFTPDPPPSSPTPSGTSITIYPPSDTLRIGGQRRFSGWDSSVGQYDVIWSLQEGAAAGTLTPDGLYTAPSTPGTFHLIATSSHNANISAKAEVRIANVGFVPVSTMARLSGHTATLLADGSVLIAGGTTDATPPGAELFLPTSGAFVFTSGGMVHPRSKHCATALPDGRVLIAGGADANGNVFKSAEVFDPATQTFSATGDLSQARADATATLLPSGKVLIAGGQDSGGILLSAELYDPTTGTFTPTGNMHVGRAQHTATLLSNGKVLIVGSSRETDNTELFDPATGVFGATGALILARAHHTATALPNGNVLVLGGTRTAVPVGGGAPPGPISVDSAEVYNPASGSFKDAGKLLIARDSHSATLLSNGTVLVAGGYSHGFDGDAQPEWHTMFAAELFDPASSSSITAASLEFDRAQHAATTLKTGQVLITGGIAGFQELCCRPKPIVTTLASAEIYQ